MKKLLLPLSLFALLIISAAECAKIAEEEILKPTAIALSAKTIAENATSGTKIATLTTTGGVAPFAYALVAGTDDADNASFAIDGAILKTKATFDFEKKTSYKVRIRTTDKKGNTLEKAFAIAVSDVDETTKPTAIALSAKTIAENNAVDAEVATLTTTGGVAPFAYALVAGTDDADNASFAIDGAILKTKAVFDFEAKPSYKVRIRTTDAKGATFAKAFVVMVTDVMNEPFITKWKTTTNGESITIPTTGSGYNYTVSWGDGTPDATGQTGNDSHTYATAGTYTVKVSGMFPRIYFKNTGAYRGRLIGIEQWGSNPWTTMESAFEGCLNMVVNATDAPDLSKVRSLSKMFLKAYALTGDFSNWDVSQVTDMSLLFSQTRVFNQSLSSWKTGAVTDMSRMFYNYVLQYGCL